MKISAQDLKAQGICDTIINEEDSIEGTAKNISAYLSAALSRLRPETPEALTAKRYTRFRNIGDFTDGA
jgi:acetyl-CoA carboxylase alpha subunit